MQIGTQLVPQLSQVAGMLIGGKKGEEIATRGALLGQIMQLGDLGKSFLSPKIGDELKKIPDWGIDWAEGMPKNPGPKGIFDGIPKGDPGGIPKGIFGGIPKGDPGGLPKGIAPLPDDLTSPLIKDLLIN